MCIRNLNRQIFQILTILSSILFSIYSDIFCQTLVQDTLFIAFPNPSQNKFLNFSIDSITDKRNEPANLISRTEKNKYVFIPVDLLICSKSALNEEINHSLNSQDTNNDSVHFRLTIDQFELKKNTSSLFFPRYTLLASFEVLLKKDNGQDSYLGNLLYESDYRKPFFKNNLGNGFEGALRNWQSEIRNDLNEIDSQLQESKIPELANLRLGNVTERRLNMYNEVDVFLGLNDWIVDGEITFSSREAKRLFFRNGYNIRYRNGDKYESIEFGLTTDNLYYRFSQNFIFKAKSQLMFGFNRWNDIEKVKHEIYDAFIADYSLSQKIVFNPLDKRSFIFSVGLMENVYYIYSKKVKFQLCLLISLGIKL